MKPSFFLDALARLNDPLTSHLATAKVNVQRMERAVTDALRVNGPMNSKEIALIMGCDRDSVSPRIRPLRLMGIVRDSGIRRADQIVWELIKP